MISSICRSCNGQKKLDIKKSLIGFKKTDGNGYRLQRRQEFKVPTPYVGNNYYRNHSVVPKECIFRKYKGPLYNEAGKICIELTGKYMPLQNFRFTTQLQNMKFQICHVQDERIKLHTQLQLKWTQERLIQMKQQKQLLD